MTETAEQDHIDRWLEEIHDQLPRLDLRVEGIVDRIGGINRRIKRMLDETLDEFEPELRRVARPRLALAGPPAAAGPPASSLRRWSSRAPR